MTGNEIQPPKGLLKLAFRLPVWLYRFKLGFLIGGRFVYVEHIGRSSGETRQAVIEVIRRDKEHDRYLVVSGYGEKSNWYQNIKKTPTVKIQVGARKAKAKAIFFNETDSLSELQDYAKRHPTAIKQLAGLVGASFDGSEEQLVHLSKRWPVIALEVIES